MKKIKSSVSLFTAAFISLCCLGQSDPLYFGKGEDLIKKTEKYLFVKISLDKKEAYQGESIVANYHLYVAVDIQGKLSKAPSFSGFSSYDLQTGKTDQYSVEVINGIPFRVYLIKSIQLYGLSAGMQRLEPIELDATIRFRKKETEEDNGYKPKVSEASDTIINYTLQSKPVEIYVRALPELNNPLFNGAVGSFKLDAFLSSPEVNKGLADTLHLILTGKGNWHEVRPPEPTWPVGIEVYEPKISEDLNPYLSPVTGTKIFSYPIVATKPGNYTLPPFSFIYFDAEQKTYHTLSTDTLRLQVRNEGQKTGAFKQQKAVTDYTKLFTGIAIAVFPLTAILLIVFLVYRKNQTKKES